MTLLRNLQCAREKHLFFYKTFRGSCFLNNQGSYTRQDIEQFQVWKQRVIQAASQKKSFHEIGQ